MPCILPSVRYPRSNSIDEYQISLYFVRHKEIKNKDIVKSKYNEIKKENKSKSQQKYIKKVKKE